MFVGDASAITENNNYQVTLNITDPSKTQEIIDEINKKVDFNPTIWTQTIIHIWRCWRLALQAHAKFMLFSEIAVQFREMILTGRASKEISLKISISVWI